MRVALIRHSSCRVSRRWLEPLRLAAATLLTFPAMCGLLQSQVSGAASDAKLTFTLDFPDSNPAHYSITVDAAGRATYECRGTVANDSEPESYRAAFEISAASRDHIFAWAKRAKYFSGTIDSGDSKLAFTGAKVLSYQDSQRSNTARYNYSNLQAVRDLTSFFQNMAGTLEYGHRLAYYHHYQKLALDEELKRMEAQARANELNEIQSVAPVLREIVEDTSVINVVRARAKDLIQLGSGPAPGH